MDGSGDPQRHRSAGGVVFRVLGAALAILVCVTAVVLLVPRDDAVGPIDAVVVLGGGAGERLALGRSLAEAHDVPLVLSAEAIALGAAEGLDCAVEVVCMHPVPVSTAGEARTAHALADARDWDRVVAATSSFHVNRARMLFGQCFGDRVDVVGADSPAPLVTDLYRYSREAAARVAGATVRRAC